MVHEKVQEDRKKRGTTGLANESINHHNFLQFYQGSTRVSYLYPLADPG
jgi:hypothetical protein